VPGLAGLPAGNAEVNNMREKAREVRGRILLWIVLLVGLVILASAIGVPVFGA